MKKRQGQRTLSLPPSLPLSSLLLPLGKQFDGIYKRSILQTFSNVSLPDVVLLNRRRMWSRLSRSQSVSFIWTSAARMSPPSVGLVLQGTEAPMWDTFSSVLTRSSARSGGPTHAVSKPVYRLMRAYLHGRGYIWTGNASAALVPAPKFPRLALTH